MKKTIVILLTLSVFVLLIACSENSIARSENSINKLHLALNNLDKSIPEIPSDERKASPFEMATIKNHWESRDGAWAIGTEPVLVAEATIKTTLINQENSVSIYKLRWESHDGIWALNNFDENIPEIPGHELKASALEIVNN